jgi:hypothetical protein
LIAGATQNREYQFSTDRQKQCQDYFEEQHRQEPCQDYFEDQHHQEPCQEDYDKQHRAYEATIYCDTVHKLQGLTRGNGFNRFAVQVICAALHDS